MGSEQSHPQNADSSHESNTGNGPKLQRGYTIAAPNYYSDHFHSTSTPPPSSSRPVSPPISVCSDSDLPYISYTDRPIGDSPKLRNRGQNVNTQNSRANICPKKPLQSLKQSKASTAHNIVVVHSAVCGPSDEFNTEIMRLKTIPMFLPVMRGTLSLPANRDPEVLERLQPAHLQNICSTMQIHYNSSAKHVASDQGKLTAKVKEVDGEIMRLVAIITEKQKLYSRYAEHFSKVRNISQQLSRCNTLLNQNIESMEYLNSFLSVEDRLEPFVWKTLKKIST